MKSNDFEQYYTMWMIFAVVINTIFLIDLILHIVFFGFKRIMQKKWEYVCELILQVIFQIWTIVYISALLSGKHGLKIKMTRFISLTLLLRNLRLLSLLWELPDYRKITETFRRFSMPFLTCMFSLYSVMFFYAVIGEYFFTGMITMDAVK